MPTTRSKQELDRLRAVAAKRVRAGESRASVARALDVSTQTLAGWALRDGWRKKDIEAERDGELSRKADALVERLNAEEAAERKKRELLDSLTRELTEAAELRLAAAKAEGAAAQEKFEAALAAMNRVLDQVGPPRPGAEIEAVAEAEAEDADADADAGAGAGQAEDVDIDVTSEASTLESMAKAKLYLQAGRLDEAERAARVAWRLRATADKLEVRQERIRLLFEEKMVAAAKARKKAVVAGFYPDRDPKNYEEKIDTCGRVIARLAFLQRRTPHSVEMEYTKELGFRWPGAGAPWFMPYCMAGGLIEDGEKPVREFKDAHPDEDETRELTVKEQAEVVYLKSMLRQWASEADPFIREHEIWRHKQSGTLARARRYTPELFKGLAPAPMEEAEAEA